MSEDDSERQTTRYCHSNPRAPRESSPSSVLCPCDWTMDGTRFSSICLTSLVALTEPITSKPCASRSTLIAAFAVSTSRTVCTPKKSFLPSSNSSCRFRSKYELENKIRSCYTGQLIHSAHLLFIFISDCFRRLASGRDE
jgi:hypothetical protein